MRKTFTSATLAVVVVTGLATAAAVLVLRRFGSKATSSYEIHGLNKSELYIDNKAL
jgi:hypothetical protein